MSNELMNVSDMQLFADSIAKSGLWGLSTPQQALSLMLLAQAEGMHPGIAIRDYHIINNKPALKADAMLARFHKAGGTVKWIDYDSKCCSATFTHPQSGSLTIKWTIEMAEKAGIAKGPTWSKYPRQMLKARVISEGIRTTYPGVVVGQYTEEEVECFEDTTSCFDGECEDVIEQNITDSDKENILNIAREGKKQECWSEIQRLKIQEGHPIRVECREIFESLRKKES
jgi:hypothetical protein